MLVIMPHIRNVRCVYKKYAHQFDCPVVSVVASPCYPLVVLCEIRLPTESSGWGVPPLFVIIGGGRWKASDRLFSM
jgi:hypothetical protein